MRSRADLLKGYVPEPTIVLMGCRPWPAPRTPVCGVCGGTVRHDGHYCAACDAVTPRMEARCRRARVEVEAPDQIRAANAAALRSLPTHRAPLLSEVQRRRLWNGYKGSLLAEHPEPTNRAKLGRDWLIVIGQVPDFALDLDHRGRVVAPEPNGHVRA